MPGSSVLVGPFQGGLSTLSDPTAIQDNELPVCDNWDIEMDGSLKSRPPFVDRGINFPLAATGNMRLLGYYYQPGYATTLNGSPFIVASDGNSSTYYFDGSTWQLITSTLSATSMVQFNGAVYLVAPTGICGSWTPTGHWVQDTAMPRGESITAYKDRLWIIAGGSVPGVDPSTVYYSATLGKSLWSPVTSGLNQSLGVQTFLLNSGDGQANVALLNFQGSLYIFRTSSIWTFNYASDPGQGTPQLLVPNIGLADQQALLIFENYIYFMFDGKAYTLFAGLATLFNPKVPFKASSRTNIYVPFAVSVFNRRILFTYYDTLYVYSLRSQNWTTWHSPTYGGIGKIVQYQGAQSSDVSVAVTHSNVSVTTTARQQKLLYLTDDFTSESEVGGYTCTMVTKTVDYGAPANFKRLFWWAVDTSYRSRLTATVNPQVYSYQITWGDLLSSGRTWKQMLDYTWDNPTLGGFSTVTVGPSQTPGTRDMRKTVRLLKNERFKQVNYSLSIDVDGTSDTCPARIFMLETFVLVKDRVSAQVT